MAVGRGEIADGLATDEIVDECSVVNECHRLRFDAVIINFVSADEALALKIVQRRVVDHAEEIRQHTRLKTGGKRTDRAIGPAELRFAAQNIGAEERGDYVVRGIRREQHRATIFLLYDGRLPKRD